MTDTNERDAHVEPEQESSATYAIAAGPSEAGAVETATASTTAAETVSVETPSAEATPAAAEGVAKLHAPRLDGADIAAAANHAAAKAWEKYRAHILNRIAEKRNRTRYRNTRRHDGNLLRRPPRRRRPHAIRKRSHRRGHVSPAQDSAPLPRMRRTSALRRSSPSTVPTRAAPRMQNLQEPLLHTHRIGMATPRHGLCGPQGNVPRARD